MNPDSTNPQQPNDPYAAGNQPQPPVPGSGVPQPGQAQPQPTPDPGMAATNPSPVNNDAASQGPPQQAQSQRPPLRIDHNLLAELGLAGLPDEEKKALEKHIYETLEMRVGMRLADQMTNEQLDEFEAYFNARDDAGAFRWLETNFPNYKDIVAEEFDKLKGEVAGQAPAILAASQQQAVAPADQQPTAAMPQATPMSPPAQPPTPGSTDSAPQSPPPSPPPQWPTPAPPPMPPSDAQPPQSPPEQ
jgi:hypothetical protein